MDFSAKMLFLSLSCAAGLFTGLFFARTVTSRRDFYEELLSFIDRMINDVGFRMDGITKVIEQTLSSGKSRLNSMLEEYKTSFSVSEPTFLPKEERRTVTSLFCGVGKSDVVTQRAELALSRNEVDEIRRRYALKCEKLCPVYTKLGLLFGLAVGILLL